MKKFIAIAAGLAFALPLSASAASISGLGTAIFSGQTNLYGNAGQTVQVSTNFDVASGEVLHAVQTDFIGDSLPPVCHVVSIVEGAQTNISVSFSETLSPNAGNYGFTMNAFTAATVPQAEALNANPGTACTGTNTSVYSQGNVAHVLPVGGTSSGSTGVSTGFQAQIDALAASVKSLTDALTKFLAGGSTGGSTTPAPTKPACPPSGDTSMVQTWLLNNGYAAGFHSHGVFSATGHWGPITTDAYAAASNACK